MSSPNAGFDDATIEKLRLAAEEVAWLTGRGYPVAKVSDFVAAQHGLTSEHRAALARGTCSEPQYRRRAARELEADDLLRKPLAIDAFDVLAAVEAALRGEPVLQTLDGTVRTFAGGRETYAPGPEIGPAVARLLEAATGLRIAGIKFVVPEGPAGAAVGAAAEEQAKKRKAKVEVTAVADVPKALRKERQIVTGDAETLDACAGWYNLATRAIESLPQVRIVRLQ